jgi:hypothetical protein
MDRTRPSRQQVAPKAIARYGRGLTTAPPDAYYVRIGEQT